MDSSPFLPVRERLDVTSYAVASFLARYRGMTLRAYKQDMRAFLRWCADRQLLPLEAERPHLELYLRWMENQGFAAATMGRRFGTVAGFYKYAVLDGHLAANPTIAVTRPRVLWEGQKRTVLHPLEYAALLTAARHDGPQAHALAHSWACSAFELARRATPTSRTSPTKAATSC
jgi:integrase/recombinase XerD